LDTLQHGAANNHSSLHRQSMPFKTIYGLTNSFRRAKLTRRSI
jgi:hypothetical protein